MVLAVVAWVGIGPLLSGGGDEPETVAVEPPPVEQPVAEPAPEPEPPRPVFPEVLVSKGEVVAGTLLRAESIEWREWLQPVDPTAAALRDVVSQDALIGAVVTRTLRDGDMITWDSIMMPGHTRIHQRRVDAGHGGGDRRSRPARPRTPTSSIPATASISS